MLSEKQVSSNSGLGKCRERRLEECKRVKNEGVVREDPSTKVPSKVWALQAFNEGPLLGAARGGGVFLLEVQYSILKSLISTCVLSYVGSREDWLLDRICES